MVTWWSGQEHRVLAGIDGVLLVVVIGDGKLVVPVNFAIRRPAPEVRVARVEAARRALQKGTLMLDGPALVEKLLEAVRTARWHACAWRYSGIPRGQ